MDIVLQSILPFVVMLVVLIVVHELGHFITARLAGVKVLEFGLGYPPRLWGIKRGETEYTINALPLGGFVRLLGEEDPSDPRSLAAQPRLTRIVVLASGAFMNLVLAILLFAMALMIPHETDISRARIVEVVPGSPAEEAGLKPGDVIFAINGEDVQNIAELGYRIRLHLGETIDVLVKRPGEGGLQELEVPVKARWTTEQFTTRTKLIGDARIAASDEPPIEVDVTSTQGLADQGVLTISAGTPNEERFEYLVRGATTLTLTERAVGDTTPQDHPPNAPVEQTRAQGPTGISIAPAYGTQVPLTPEERAELEEQLGPDAEIPTTRLIPYSETQWSNPLAALKEGAIRAWEWVIFTIKWVISLVMSFTQGGESGIGDEGVRGPVGIAEITGDVVEQAGWQSLLELAAVISMSLAALNILPLPMLDGGRVAFVVLEILRGGRRIAPEREAMVHFVGLVAILTLAVVITYFDVLRLFEG